MPTIKKLKRRGRQSYRAAQRHELYKLPQWRELSRYVRALHPVCSICEAMGATSASEHVHHIVSPFAGALSEGERVALLLDSCNVIALCASCHSKIHSGELHIPPELLKIIADGSYFNCR